MNKHTYFTLNAMFAIMLLAGPVAASPNFSDTFDVGTATTGDDADPADVPFFTRGGHAANLTLSPDATFGSGNALTFDTTGGAQPVFASFDSDMSDGLNWTGASDDVAIQIGEKLVLGFDLHHTETPLNAGSGFMFGLYNDPEGPVTGNATFGDTDNAAGYFARIATGTNSGTEVYKEDGSASSGPIASTGSGPGTADVSSLGTEGNGVIPGTAAHNIRLELDRTDTDAITVSLFIDNQLYATGTDSSSTLYAFNTAVFKTGPNIGWAVDNVELTVVPEPSSISVILSGGLMMLYRLRRKGRG